MTHAPAGAPGLVRVSVASGTRRVDLVLPGAIPVAELVPELARSVGLLDASSVYGGYRVVTAEGRQLAHDAGLTLQGVEDGAVLTVAAGVDAPDRIVYDDVVEAMTDIVERDLAPWDPASGRRTALAAAVVLLGLGAIALALQGLGGTAALPGTAAALVAAALVAAAVVLSRAQGEPEAAVTVAWLGGAYAAVAGLVLAPADADPGVAAVSTGGAVLLVGTVAALGLAARRPLVLPLVVLGALVAVWGGVIALSDVDPGAAALVVATVMVLVGSVFPWIALSVTGTRVEAWYSVADLVADPEDIDPDRVAADARLGHEILVAISATVGLLLVLATRLAVDRGLAGTLLVVTAAVVLMIRTRQYRTGAEVRVGLLSGIATLAATAASVLLRWPDWRPATAVVLAAAGALMLAATLVPGAASVRRGRVGDVLETIALLALVPLLVVAVRFSGS
ncbi:type VII secretion integral membrane protein EccD [Nocardioides sp.]|uniref:type VII secretion integral membrane protein EccD n=1 Tax=Nocardioides sp. TaxID=35761 RepID=UPI003517CAD6